MVPNFPRYMSYFATHAFFFLHLENILFEMESRLKFQCECLLKLGLCPN
jgi:hypothetical protein